jgi:hypothetical protein
VGARNRDRTIPRNPTLADVVRLEGYVYGFCEDCIRSKVLPLQTLIDRFGATAIVGDLEPPLVCTMCGHKNVRIDTKFPR